MGHTFFISGAFQGHAELVRHQVRSAFHAEGHAVLEKHGGNPEPVASLLERSDGLIFILGAAPPVIEDAFGRYLVEAELRYAAVRRMPILPILLGVPDESALHKRVRALRDEVRRKLPDSILELPTIVDGAPLESSGPAVQTAWSRLTEFARKCSRELRFPPLDTRVFISYSHADAEPARRIRDHLLAENLAPWLDAERLSAGNPLSLKIRDAISTSSTFLVLLSPAAMESDWVGREISIAREIEKPMEQRGTFILPVLLEPIHYPPALRFLEDRVHIDATNWNESPGDVLREITGAVKMLPLPDAYQGP